MFNTQSFDNVFYIVMLSTTLVIGFYSLIYTREVLRIEQTIGMPVPGFVRKLLKGITMFAFILAIIIGITGILSSIITHA